MGINKLCEIYDTVYSKLSVALEANGYDRAIVDELSEGITGKLNSKIDDTILPFLEHITKSNRPYHDSFTASNLLRLLQSGDTAFCLTCGIEAPLALMCIYLVEGTLTEATYYFARNGEEAEDDGMCDSGYKIGICYTQDAFSTVKTTISSSATHQLAYSGIQHSLAGKNIVVTGDLINFPEPGPYPQRVEFRKLVEKHGGKLTSSVSGKTSYLICNDKNSGTIKVRQALEKNIPILTEKEFLGMVGFLPESVVIPQDNDELIQYQIQDKTVAVPDATPIIVPHITKDMKNAARDWLHRYGHLIAQHPQIEFAGRNFVCTGFTPTERSVCDAIVDSGGKILAKVSKNVDFLIVKAETAGDQKIEQVISQRQKGNRIEIILLEDVERILFPNRVKETARVYIGIKDPDIANIIRCNAGAFCTVLKSMNNNIHLHLNEDVVTLVTLTNLYEYEWNLSASYRLANAYWDTQRHLEEVIPNLTVSQMNKINRRLQRAITTGNIIARSNYDRTFKQKYFTDEDFLETRILWGAFNDTIIGCIEKENGNPELVIPPFHYVSNQAFRNCEITQHIIAGDGVKLGPEAFAFCRSIEKLTLGNIGEILHRQLCENCSSLKEVELSEGIYRIDERAFAGCQNLRKINIPDTVMFIAPTAFADCVRLAPDVLEKIRKLSDWNAFDEQVCDAERYIQRHGDSGYSFDHLSFYATSPDGVQRSFDRRWSYGELFKKKVNIQRWCEIHMPYFDTPNNLLKGKVTYAVFANKDVVIDMSAYGWKQQKKSSEFVDYLIVDTTNIPSFDRFVYKMRAIDEGTWKTVENFGLNALEKAIEAKKAGSNIQIITREYLESCIAKNAFIEKFVFPTKAEKQAIEAQHREEEQAEREDRIAELLLSMKDQCESTGIKYSTMAEFWRDSRLEGLKFLWIEQYIRERYQQKIEEYLTQNGMLMTDKERILAQIEEVLDILTQRYVGANKKAMSVRDLARENPDVDMRVLTEHAAFYTGKKPRVLLTERGIIYSDEELQSGTNQPKNPAQIPENIRKRMDTLFAKLDEAYPDKVLVRINQDHKKWGETISELYRALGYENAASFLSAYGYTYAGANDKGGRPKKNPMEIIEELQRRYPNGTAFTTVDELKAANPDIASRFQSLRNKSNEYFGMPFTQYLRSIGLIK